MPERDMKSMCPSAQPEMTGSRVLGVVEGEAGARVRYLSKPLPVDGKVLNLVTPMRPTEVLRIAADCATTACTNFDGTHCTLVQRITRLLPPVVSTLPACHLRPTCRWWHQEKAEACMRCPQIVTTTVAPASVQREVAEPPHL
ncbi:hypothetical protein GA0115259_104018 [Streptomyces sp. MnatMP-M17]|nr:hypothetical protein GA0115259_104018 [Streptomyces sp. MnatMP-M17]